METGSKEEGVYLYCIVNSGESTEFGDVGIDDKLVYTVPHKDIGAVVHKCCAETYQTDDEEKAKDWILTHQYVIDLATGRCGTVIPLRFDTVFKGDDITVERWLREEYERLRGTLRKFKGKAEYGVQIYLKKGYVEEMIENNREMATLRRSLEGRPKGSAYLLRKNLEKMVKVRKDVETRSLAKKFFEKIRGLVDELRLEKNVRDLPGKWKDELMILNLSCLVQHDRVNSLGDLLGEINSKPGFTVRFTGPWPPYSFVPRGEKGGNR